MESNSFDAELFRALGIEPVQLPPLPQSGTMEVDSGLFAFFQEMQHVADSSAPEFEHMKSFNAMELTGSIAQFIATANSALSEGREDVAREHAAAVAIIAAIYAAKFGALLG